MNPWRVFFFDQDITTLVSSVRIRWETDNIAGECTVEVADRTACPVPQWCRRRYSLPTELLSLDLRELRLARVLPVRVEEYVWDGWEEVWVSRGEFMIERISYGSNVDALTATLWGRSRSALLGAPFAGKVTKQWEQAVGTTDIIEEVASPYGVPVDPPPGPGLEYDESFAGREPRGYPINPGAYSVAGKTPAEIIRELIEITGNRVIPLVDGSVGHWLKEYPDWVDLFEDAFILDSITVEPPEYGARVLFAPESRPKLFSVTVKVLTRDEEVIPANGVSKARLLAVIRDDDGELVIPSAEAGPVSWEASDGTISAAELPENSHGYIVEEVTATEYTKATLRHQVGNVAAVYLSSSHVPSGFRPGDPPVRDYPFDPSDKNLLVSLNGNVHGGQIVFSENLPYYDQPLWVVYEPLGWPGTYTADTRQGVVEITVECDANKGSCTVQQGVPGRGNTLEFYGPDDACYGDAGISLTVLGRVSGAPATGEVRLSIEGCGVLDAVSAVFGQGSVTETLIVEETVL